MKHANLILGASLGNCVHVAGVAHFLNLAEDEGYRTVFGGPAVPVDRVIRLIGQHNPQIVALGYRLTPQNVIPLVEELRERAGELDRQPIWVFGGTPPVAKAVAELHFFDHIFDGTEDIDDCISYLRQTARGETAAKDADNLIDRIGQKVPYPVLRHHFGLPSYEETVAGVAEIAESRVLDVISLGIDQNTQQFFYHPEDKDPAQDGAGGVPVRTPEEFRRLKEAADCGNHPLMRCYAGTADVHRFGEMLYETIDNAWCASSLFWFNELDGRGTRKVEESMRDSHRLIRWHAERRIPVEVNEPHHWGLRDAHDVVSVAASYLSAYHAKKLGVEHYISQYMFNIPNAMSFSMDLAKVLAQIEVSESLMDDGFQVYRQTRAGLPFLSADLQAAKGQLASSTMLQMAVKPHIIHVVGYSEAQEAATPEIVVESTRIVRGVIRSTLHGGADMTADPAVQRRKEELVGEAKYLLDFIRVFYADAAPDPLFDPAVLADCVRRGILDAPHILRGDACRGILRTRMVDGRCVAWDEENGREMSEEQRIESLKEAGLLEENLDNAGHEVA